MNHEPSMIEALAQTPLVPGAGAGLAATAPMSLAMLALRALLPPVQRYPLPPEQITVRVIAESRAFHFLSKPLRQAATVVLHFGYGAGAGAAYAVLGARLPVPAHLPTVAVGGRQLHLAAGARGIVFGLALWAAGYLGWLPALGILSPATDQPMRRNLLMISAHVVWGGVTGLLVDLWAPAAPPAAAAGPAPDLLP